MAEQDVAEVGTADVAADAALDELKQQLAAEKVREVFHADMIISLRRRSYLASCLLWQHATESCYLSYP